MNTDALSYNTGRNHLVIQEYGRNIQQMIEHLLTIEDKTNRTQAAYFVVSVMAQMNPQVKETEDFMHKLWDHMHIIADYKLDVDGPYEVPSKEIRNKKPEHPGYGQKKPKYGHYGHYLMAMIDIAKSIEDEEEKKAISLAIANQMKKDYLNWNRETVNDNIILMELERVSDGALTLPEDTRLIAPTEVLGRNPGALSAAKKKKPNKKKDFSNKRVNNPRQR
ncbi:MAG: DUF4290 domain-containing protein [Bacteroidetes bacterium]|jgi:hypothetical protein|nr:DUF4290 domain-containing protein [Bacteroidota bacterium]